MGFNSGFKVLTVWPEAPDGFLTARCVACPFTKALVNYTIWSLMA